MAFFHEVKVINIDSSGQLQSFIDFQKMILNCFTDRHCIIVRGMSNSIHLASNSVFGKNWQDSVIRKAGLMDITLMQNQARLMAIHAKELLFWNRTINLTSITDPLDMVINHYVDCLAIAPLVKDTDRILDMGSGGGFPGIPLKIHMPSLKLVLVDASRKKVSFLKHICRMLGLEDVEVLQNRAETLGELDTCAQGFDIVVSRAFSSLEKFFMLSHKLIRSNGKMVAMKGILPNKEIDNLQWVIDNESQSCFTVKPATYRLPLSRAQRSVIEIIPCSFSIKG
jgi:16S rRNA (guanine527-N7)-methyltransferase